MSANRILVLSCAVLMAGAARAEEGHHEHAQVDFTVRSVKSGEWSDMATWKPARVPGKGDRVLVSRGTRVRYDVSSKAVIRLLQVVGALEFARDRDTELNVAVLKVQDSDTCSESGFACDFDAVNDAGEPQKRSSSVLPELLIGSRHEPIPAAHTARVRLHSLEDMKEGDAPAIACCSARMEIHGAPLSRTWVELGADAARGANRVETAETVEGWRVGDEVIVTGTDRGDGFGSYRKGSRREKEAQTESRRIVAIEGRTLELDRALEFDHEGSGKFRGEVANLSRNVVIESADPTGVRGHTVFHRFSRGSISYARFAHLGKEGVLGRYSIHFHLVGDTMRGASVVGAAIVDSHNRWITIHGTRYLVVRDCVGYQSVGHGFFLEDGTEIYNLLDRNLGVQSYRAERLPRQVLPFDPNDGAAFWWANGRNTLARNVACENDEYGFRYDMQSSRSFDSTLPIVQPDGNEARVDVRTIPIWRFEGNEAHTNFAGMVVAANGGRQPDSPIRNEGMLRRIKRVDWTGPDTRHPHVVRDFDIWESHYAFRPQSPSMLIENVTIDRAAYGIYRPALENQVYRNLSLARVGPEPFNRGMDDASAQTGSITVDGLRLERMGNSSQYHPIVHMSDNNLSGDAECHFRNVTLVDCDRRRPVFNRGGSVRVDPYVKKGVPYFIHDHFGPGRDAKIVSTKAKSLMEDGGEYVEERPLTGDESRIAEVGDVEFPELLEPVDDVPPATIITDIRRDESALVVRGVSHDNGEIVSITVNEREARVLERACGVVDWEANLDRDVARVVARARDAAGNLEKTAHAIDVREPSP